MASARFYTSTRLGPKQSLTPEGFLVCHDVPIARVGTLLYGEGEVPLEAGPDGVISISRDADAVFSPDAIASFLGKSVTNDHPDNGTKVTSKNWRDLEIGQTVNVRRGDGAVLDSDYLYADLLIKDPDAIKDVRAGKREVSAGYDAEYEQTGRGQGRQHDIIGNHVALVDRGRCGPRCSIGDSDTMATKRGNFADRIRHAYRTRDEAALVDELKKVGDMMGEVVGDADMDPLDTSGGDDSHKHITINVNGGAAPKMPDMPAAGKTMQDDDEVEPMPGSEGGADEGGAGDVAATLQEVMQRLETIEKAIILLSKEEGDEDHGDDDDDDDDTGMGDNPDGDDTEKPGEVVEEDKPATGDRRRRAAVGDSSSLAAAWQDVASKAEILAPGLVKVPTFDSAKPAKMTFDTLCNLRRTALAKAWGTEDGREAVKALYTKARPNFTRDAMSCQEVTTLFNGAATFRKRANTAATTDGVRKLVMDKGRETGFASHRAVTPADINARAREIFKNT